MKRALIVSAVTTSLLAVPATAQADPPYISRADAELQQEAADTYVAPPWITHPQIREDGYSYADVIVGVALVVGLVALW